MVLVPKELTGAAPATFAIRCCWIGDCVSRLKGFIGDAGKLVKPPVKGELGAIVGRLYAFAPCVDVSQFAMSILPSLRDAPGMAGGAAPAGAAGGS